MHVSAILLSETALDNATSRSLIIFTVAKPVAIREESSETQWRTVNSTTMALASLDASITH